MRLSVPIPWHTCCTFAPTDSQIEATALMNEIFIARNAFEACLISSALLAVVTISGGGSPAPAGGGEVFGRAWHVPLGSGRGMFLLRGGVRLVASAYHQSLGGENE